jgi:hypothetical protein
MKVKEIIVTSILLLSILQVFSIETVESAFPTVTAPSPTNASSGVSKDLENVSVTIGDTDVHTMNITWLTNSSGSWNTFDTTVNETNGTYYSTNVSWSNGYYNTTYWWRVLVEDGNGNTINMTYHFRTLVNTPPAFSNDTVTNLSCSAVNWSVYINDTNGDTFNWTIECSGINNTGNDETNGTKRITIYGLNVSTNYTVYVNCTDSYNATNQTYNITTDTVLDIWFDCTVSGGLVTCIGHHNGTLSQYSWNLTTTSGLITGTTGWINHTTENIYYAFSVGEESEFDILFYGKNTNESDYEAQFAQTTYNAPEEEPESPEYIPEEGLGPVNESEPYDINVAGMSIDIRFPIFIIVLVVILYVFFEKNKKRPIKKRLPSGRLVIINHSKEKKR